MGCAVNLTNSIGEDFPKIKVLISYESMRLIATFSTACKPCRGTVDKTQHHSQKRYSSPMNEEKKNLREPRQKNKLIRFQINSRIILGGTLIAISFISAYIISDTNNRMTTVWSATTDLAPGEIIEAGDVIESRVLLPNNASSYLDGSNSIVGSYVVRALGSSELIPAYALSTESGAHLRRIPISIPRSRVPTGIGSGSQIDIYGLPKDQLNSNFNLHKGLRSRALLINISVDAIDIEASKMGGDIGITILVPQELVAGFISSMTDFDFIVVKRI
jgi:hypothetical protein